MLSYEKMKPDFHDQLLNSKNPLRAWFHKSRLQVIQRLAHQYSSESSRVVDLGCGSCSWNTERRQVIGIDVNEAALQYAVSEGRLAEYQCADIGATGLIAESVDLVIAAEVLEHIEGYERVIREMHRILKPSGVAIVSVPYDTFFSLWKPLFFIHCFVQGQILGDDYFKNQAGHINHFSPARLQAAFVRNGFQIREQSHLKRLTIFLVAVKASGSNAA